MPNLDSTAPELTLSLHNDLDRDSETDPYHDLEDLNGFHDYITRSNRHSRNIGSTAANQHYFGDGNYPDPDYTNRSSSVNPSPFNQCSYYKTNDANHRSSPISSTNFSRHTTFPSISSRQVHHSDSAHAISHPKESHHFSKSHSTKPRRASSTHLANFVPTLLSTRITHPYLSSGLPGSKTAVAPTKSDYYMYYTHRSIPCLSSDRLVDKSLGFKSTIATTEPDCYHHQTSKSFPPVAGGHESCSDDSLYYKDGEIVNSSRQRKHDDGYPIEPNTSAFDAGLPHKNQRSPSCKSAGGGDGLFLVDCGGVLLEASSLDDGEEYDDHDDDESDEYSDSNYSVGESQNESSLEHQIQSVWRSKFSQQFISLVPSDGVRDSIGFNAKGVDY
jgi:hypothetical protein